MWKGVEKRRSHRVTALLLIVWLGEPSSHGKPNWRDGEGFRMAPLVVTGQERPVFVLSQSNQTWIQFFNRLVEGKSLLNQILLNGSGVAAGDVDGDNLCDLYFCGLDSPNRLYRNLGDWRFEDITASSGTACRGLDCTGTALVDLDGDRDLDLLVNTVFRGTLCFRNEGEGIFTDVTKNSGIIPSRGAMTFALADIDGDTLLDLYVVHYRATALMDMPNTDFNLQTVGGEKRVSHVNGRSVNSPEFKNRYRVNSRGGIEENGVPDLLYKNLGGMRFRRVPFTGGAFLDESGKPLGKSPFDWGLAAMFRDINRDGKPDLFVCNDFDSPDRFWLNLGGGRFQAIHRFALRQTSHFSMGVDFADVNRDGLDDFFVLDMLGRSRMDRMTQMEPRLSHVPVPGRIDDRPQYMRNTLFLNRGNLSFAETARMSGVSASDWSWCPAFLDVDLDGLEDLLITNGHERNARHLDVILKLRKQRTQKKMTNREILMARAAFPRLATPNLAFRNQGGIMFHETSAEWGFDFNGVSHGMALADLDGDGDLDVALNNLNAPAAVYRNDTHAPRIAVALRGHQNNTRGIGARIEVHNGARAQSQEIISGGKYLSSDQPIRVFAANGEGDYEITVFWTGGGRTLISGVVADHLYEISQDSLAVATAETEIGVRSLFEEVSKSIGHKHQENAFNDYERQPLLSLKLSQDGPGVAWIDLNRDGWEDLVIGAGRGGALEWFVNDRHGGFSLGKKLHTGKLNIRDDAGLACWSPPGGSPVVAVASSNHEDGLAFGDAVRFVDATPSPNAANILATAHSAGPLAVCDVDMDDDLDLFVGGRAIPGRHPATADSRLYLWEAGKWIPHKKANQMMKNCGLATGAVFTDLRGDGWPDLVVACEWGAIRIFENQVGRLEDTTAKWGLGAWTGLWRGVNAGDFNGDGRMDLVAANWGRNSEYQLTDNVPIRLYHGDLDDNGTWEVMETKWEGDSYALQASLSRLVAAVPWITESINSYAGYAKSSISSLLSGRFERTFVNEVTTLETSVFLNTADGFERISLPVEAQLTAAFAPVVADFNGDGQEDVFLSQNFFPVHNGISRQDAGVGLILLGDGRGRFSVASSTESGIEIHGEGRGAAMADFDHDGRTDLAVAQNGGQTKLYRNRLGRPGIRVTLRGTKGNPHAIGAMIRIESGGQPGPAREIHAGSGYWSQDGFTQVMSGAEKPIEKIWIRWPAGREVRHSVSSGQKAIMIQEPND